MSRVTSNPAVMLVGLLLLAVVLVAGCTQSPVDPATQEQPQLLKRVTPAGGDASLAPVNLYAEQVISADSGGTLSLLDVTLVIPPGAVPNDTLFSIFIPDAAVFFNEFGTDGLQVDVPVTVTMSYRDADMTGVNESNIRIAWYNPAKDRFEDLPCTVDLVNKTVTAQLRHFSAYGLISD